MNKKIIYKTVISYTILSEELFYPMSLTEIDNFCDDGKFIGGNFLTPILNQELAGKNAVTAITNLYSNPELFNMDCQGNDISNENNEYEIDLESD